MAGLSVQVSVAKLGKPNTGLSKKRLGALELVKFKLGNFEIDTLDVRQAGKCHYVEDCGITVPIDVDYFIAKELQDDIDNANKRSRSRFISIFKRIAQHARTHYHRVVRNVVPSWSEDLRKELRSVLPTRKSPTDLGKDQIETQIASLVAYYVELLASRIRQDVHQWEKADYPRLEKFAFRLHVIWQLAVPRAPKSKRKNRPKIHFPSCNPKTSH